MTARIEITSPPRNFAPRPDCEQLADVAPSFPSWPVCADEECEAAERVLRSGKLNYWTGGEGREFEREFAEYVGCQYAVAVANGTVALELALGALGVGPGDEVVVPSRTFVATAMAVSRCGATPVFADVDRDSQNVSADSIRRQLTDRARAVIVVHLAGWPCDMDPILELARGRNLRVIEDCAQAHGARYKGRAVGSLGDVGAYSFCQDKIITTAGEGGMIVTNRRDLWQRAWSFKDHGKNYEAMHQPATSHGFRWLHESVGTNWRLTEVQSAIGRIALRKLDAWVATRRRYAAVLNDSFLHLPGLRTTIPHEDIFHSYYKYYAFVRPERLATGWNRDRILAKVSNAGIPCFAGSCSEIYLEKAFHSSLRPRCRLPMVKELGETSLMLPIHPTLDVSHVKAAARQLALVMTAASAGRPPEHDIPIAHSRANSSQSTGDLGQRSPTGLTRQ